MTRGQDQNKQSCRDYCLDNSFHLFPIGDILQSSAQRLALPAGGWDEITPKIRIPPKPEKCLKTRRVPASQVHAVLGGVSERKTPSLKEDTTARLTTLLHAFLLFSTDKYHNLLEH